MTFKIIDGGCNETPEEKKKNIVNKIEQLKVFVNHMRALENSIASIKSMATKIEWDELDKRLTSCHDQVLDTLAYVKKSSKGKILERDEKPKSKNFLKLLE